MSRGLSVHIGVSNSNGHAGPIGTALGCDRAAQEMQALAAKMGFTTPALLCNEQATHTAVVAALDKACKDIGAHELLLITLAGHGRQLSGPGHGGEVHDQALVLYDDYLVDDEIYEALKGIQRPARVVIVADGCFTGSIHMLVGLFRRTGASSHPWIQTIAECQRREKVTADILLIPATSSTSVASALELGGVPIFTRALLEKYEGSTSYEDLVVQINDFIDDRAPDVELNRDLLLNGSALPLEPPFHP